MDDPAMIGGIVNVVYSVSAVPLVFCYLIAFLAVVMMTLLFRRFRDIARLSASMGVSYLLAFALLRWDPGDLVCWYMD